jgi:hypothetical protein
MATLGDHNMAKGRNAEVAESADELRIEFFGSCSANSALKNFPFALSAFQNSSR